MDTFNSILPLGIFAIAIGIIVVGSINRLLARRDRQRWLIAVDARRGQWPDSIVDYLLAHPRVRPLAQIESVMVHHPAWPDFILLTIIQHKVRPGMTSEMVLASWGRPNVIQKKEITKTGQKTRWVYGQPRRGAQYLWFTNDELTKIQS